MSHLHPTAIIDDSVVLGENVTVGAFACIYGPTVIGDNVWIGAHTVIGALPEVRDINHHTRSGRGDFGVLIGNDTVVREAVQIHSGTHRATTIGEGSFVMNQAYVAHDAVIGSRCILSSGVRLAGHVQVGSGSNFGMNATVHQRIEVGRGVMIGMGAAIVLNTPSYAKVVGVPGRVIGLNTHALERDEISIAELRRVATSEGWSEHDAGRWIQ